MSTEIDIYADKPVHTIDYMVAIMLAAKAGKKIQLRGNYPSAVDWFSWTADDAMNWAGYTYRVDPAEKPKIAEGNNPEHLTEEQVGVKEGWRLVTREELEYRERSSSECVVTGVAELLVFTTPVYWVSGPLFLTRLGDTYRTKKPAGYFLSKPKVRVALTRDDLKGHCLIWIRRVPSFQSSQEFLVCSIVDNGFYLGVSYHRFRDLTTAEYSTDRINWKPCYKEVES